MIEASGFLLKASTGCSVISMICLAGTISTLDRRGRTRASSGSRIVGSPTSRKFASDRRAASNTPCATTCGPLSPPIASTAIRIRLCLAKLRRVTRSARSRREPRKPAALYSVPCSDRRGVGAKIRPASRSWEPWQDGARAYNGYGAYACAGWSGVV